MREVAAILLAAGQATRFGGAPEDTKLAADIDGKPLVRYVAEAALASRAYPVGLVTGHAAAKVLGSLAGLDLFAVHNAAYAEGLSGSLRAGLAALPEEVRGAVILLADMPFVTGAVIDQLIACFEAEPIEPDAVVPVRKGRHGNPVLIGRNLFPEIAKLQGDRGAKAVLNGSSYRILECPIDDPAIEIDVDTRETLNGLAGLTLPSGRIIS
jgi:molybdenum cofactor cytidylyltransferase